MTSLQRTQFIINLENKTRDQIKEDVQDLELLISLFSGVNVADTETEYKQAIQDLNEYKVQRAVIKDLYGL